VLRTEAGEPHDDRMFLDNQSNPVGVVPFGRPLSQRQATCSPGGGGWPYLRSRAEYATDPRSLRGGRVISGKPNGDSACSAGTGDLPPYVFGTYAGGEPGGHVAGYPAEGSAHVARPRRPRWSYRSRSPVHRHARQGGLQDIRLRSHRGQDRPRSRRGLRRRGRYRRGRLNAAKPRSTTPYDKSARRVSCQPVNKGNVIASCQTSRARGDRSV